MQHTATHCNTLQHTTPHCNTLQHNTTCVAVCCSVSTLSSCITSIHFGCRHTATHCNTLQHTATHYKMRCNVLQCGNIVFLHHTSMNFDSFLFLVPLGVSPSFLSPSPSLPSSSPPSPPATTDVCNDGEKEEEEEVVEEEEAQLNHGNATCVLQRRWRVAVCVCMLQHICQCLGIQPVCCSACAVLQ